MSDPAQTPAAPAVVMLPGSYFVGGSAAVAVSVFLLGYLINIPVWLLGAEVLATILGLFLLGSFRFQVHKNAITYGMLLVIVATFCALPASRWHAEITGQGWAFWIHEHLLSFHGLEDLIHIDTMLFILGLTLFVSVIAQTRVLEGLTFVLLRRNKGFILPTVISVTAVVAVASGLLGGVSMIGLTIRTFVIILMLAAVPTQGVRFAVIVCTAVTTICGVFTAYGEPPNLIMKANLYPHLDNVFFLRFGIPVAIASFLVIAWEMRGQLGRPHVDLDTMDVLDANAEDVRFLQATRHGEVMTPVELIEGHAPMMSGRADAVIERMRMGESLGIAMIRADVSEPTRRDLLGHYVSEELADGLDRHYVLDNAGRYEEAFRAELAVDEVLATLAPVRRRAQFIGALALLPFAVMLAVHSVKPEVPLFLASFAGFLTALPGIARIPRMRKLAMREAYQEYAEYYFLFPLFLSITLLTAAGFFDAAQDLVRHGVETLGQSHVAYLQFLGSTFLSAILDNNVVADFASRGLHGLDVGPMRLFAIAQIAGYALGGCWTHIGCAQSVVAYAFILRDVDAHYTPVQWIREITPVILKILLVLTVLIYAESALLAWL